MFNCHIAEMSNFVYLVRSASLSGGDTEESDAVSGAGDPPRRRRRTWDQARTESLSSDLSRYDRK